MTREEAIELIHDIQTDAVYSILPEEKEALDMAISALKESRPKGEWDIFGYPSDEDIRQCNEDYICSNCKNFVINRRMKALCNFCPNCGADMRGKAE